MEWLWASECAGCGVIGLGRLCWACRGVDARRLPLGIDTLAGAFTLDRYATPLGGAVRQAKINHDRHLAEHLGRLFARRLAPHVADAGFTALVAAPSTPVSLVRRGFSLAAVLAHALSRDAAIPDVPALRRLGGRRQATLRRDERRANLAGRLTSWPVSGRVLVVDDVVTTGATARACAEALRRAGADEVWLAVVVAAVDAPIAPLPPRREPDLGALPRRATRSGPPAGRGARAPAPAG